MIDVLKHLKWFFKQEYKRYIVAAITLLVLSVISVFPARILGLVIEEIASRTITVKKIILYSSLLLLIPVVRYIVNIIYHYLINALGKKVAYELRDKYLNHLFELDASAYSKYTKGDLIARATNDLEVLTVVCTGFLQSVVFNTGVVLSAVFMMLFTIDPILTLVSILIMPIAIFRLNKVRMKKRQYYKIHHEIYAEMTEKVLESIEGVKTVRAYCQEENDFVRAKEAIDADINSWRKILKFETLFTPLFEFIYAFSYFVAFAFGSYMVITSRITTGDLITFVMYIGMLYGPLVALSNVLNTINNAIIADNRYHEIMNLVPLVKDEEKSSSVFTFEKIEFKNVSFKYPFDHHEIIKNINFTINKGETIGIVGPTGAGKSTLIRQLLREFNVTSGEILIDGKNIENFKIEDVHNLVGYVPQAHILFRKTVDENILIGNPKASPAQIDMAVTLSDFKKDIKDLAYGSETMVGELGASLSGGQRQRLSIARALVKNPEILILDDSLSAVDALTEANIIGHLKKSRSDKTNIIVAHRFSAIYQADKIIVLENGKITNVGTHRELLGYDNWYKRQYIEQLANK
ncbi:MAG TPA: ABC transporter ATP-binding protein [Bacilli bacterium]|jgi:ATP-binding cassette subfamily B protein|nr:ABC transporter ATP-binding protein [Acholeplasmataceae bacterium]HNZ77958.1 ABC transporter ATP-binding protein [Bacilli bacterium]HOD61557.1 ABC transporter ATP-binding protein [Bacilli bacterium]HOH62155.1 ABC transporter ATP-binding protein [Bacilli bacterium]HPB49390.1 ABC transporter ATP-binding protein [Bacilli bacterium]